MKPDELKELLDKVRTKARQETIKEIINFTEDYFFWDKECFIRTLKKCYEEELEDGNGKDD